MTTFVIFAALGSRHAFIMEQTVARRPVHPLDHLQGTAARLANLLPDAAHHRLAEWLKHPHTHPDLDPAIRTLLAVRDWRGGKKAFSHDPVLARARFRREMLMIRPQPTAVGDVVDLMVDGAACPLAARLYRPAEALSPDQPLPLLVFLHGGGYVVGDLDTHDEPCRLLCRFGRMLVLSVEYRLAPEHPFPAAYDDTVAALRFAKIHAATWGADPDQVAVGGDSAGGNLAATAAANLAGTPDAPAAQLLIYAGIEFYMQTESKQRYSDGLFLSHDDVRDAYLRYNPDERFAPTDPRLCPIYAPSHANLAPALVISAEYDVLRDEAEVYARKLREAGTVCMMRRVAGQAHGFINITAINRRAYQATVQMAVDFRLLLDGEVF